MIRQWEKGPWRSHEAVICRLLLSPVPSGTACSADTLASGSRILACLYFPLFPHVGGARSSGVSWKRILEKERFWDLAHLDNIWTVLPLADDPTACRVPSEAWSMAALSSGFWSCCEDVWGRMDSRLFCVTFFSVWKLLGFSLCISRSFKIPQECISLGVFRSPSWDFFRPLRSENPPCPLVQY